MISTLLKTFEEFQGAGVENPLLETLSLFDILSNGAVRRLPDDFEHDLDLRSLAQRRKAGMPLEYIVGRATFMGLELLCSPATLIPRHETELLARVALSHASDLQRDRGPLLAIDVGTGCGNLAATLATYGESTHVLASDISEAAVDIARANVARLGLKDRVTLFCGDMFAPMRDAGHADGSIDMIVCNPPYIPTSSLKNLPPEIIDFEPIKALDAGAYGVDIFRVLIRGATELLRSGGVLAFEIGERQEKLVERILERSRAFTGIARHSDSEGHVRTLCAIRE